MEHARSITPAMIAAFKADYDADREARVLTAAVTHSPLGKAAMDPMAAAKLEDRDVQHVENVAQLDLP